MAKYDNEDTAIVAHVLIQDAVDGLRLSGQWLAEHEELLNRVIQGEATLAERRAVALRYEAWTSRRRFIVASSFTKLCELIKREPEYERQLVKDVLNLPVSGEKLRQKLSRELDWHRKKGHLH